MTLTINDLTNGGAPKVEVQLTGLAASVATVTGYRLANGREHVIRGMIRVAVSGGGTWVDFAVPAQQATYKVEMFDSSGSSLGFTESVDVTLGFSGCWMHNPLSPSGAVRVTLLDTAGGSLSRPVPGSVVYPKGRRVGVMVANPRRGVAGGVFDVFCDDLDTADAVQAFLGDYTTTTVPVICVRPGVDYAGLRVTSPMFLGVNDIAEEGVDVRFGGEATIQRIRGDEVSEPAPGVFVPLLTRADLNAYYATRQDLNESYLTRLSANGDYDLSGYAG